MSRRRLATTFALLFAACAAVAAAQVATAPQAATTAPATTSATVPTTLPSAQALIDRYVAATGGAEAYASLKTRRASGTFALPDLGINGTVTTLLRNDGHALITIDVPGIGVVRQGMDNGVVWAIHPADGPKILTGVEANVTRRSLALSPETTLEGYKSATVTGLTDVNGRPAYELALVSDGGVKETRFYDVETGLFVKSVGTLASEGGELTVTTFYTDYEDAPPIRMAMKVRQTMSGVSPEQSFTKVEHNVELPDALFALPPEIVKLQQAQAATRPAGGPK